MKNVGMYLVPFLVLNFLYCAPQIAVKEPISLKKYYDSDYHRTNRLVAFQTGLSLPKGWSFSKPRKEDFETVVYRFDDGEGFIKGLYQYFATEIDNISPIKLTEHMAETENDKYNKSIHKVYIDNKEAYILTSKQKQTDLDFFDCYIVEGSNYNLIRLYSEPGHLFENPEIAYKIFYSYNFEKKGVNIRSTPDLPRFECLSGNWRWYNDYSSSGAKAISPSGYAMITSKDSPYRAFIAVEKTNHTKADRHLAQYYTVNLAAYDVEEFDTLITFGGDKFSAKAIGRTADEYGYAELALILNRENQNLFIRLRGKREDFSLDAAKDLLSEDFIAGSLKNNFSL
ncbi:MAG: hypothetical protein ACLFQB_07840 [Chitinispirillaceae bacterium]